MKHNILIIIVCISFAHSQPDTLWTKTFGGTDIDEGNSVHQTYDGGYIIIGNTMSFGDGSIDVWLIKTDADGNEEWNQTFGGESADIGQSVLQTTDNGFAILGYTHSFGNGGNDVWIIKTDENGNEEWNQTFGGVENEYGSSIIQTIEAGFIIVGWKNSIGNGGNDVWIIKTDENGNEEWNQTFGGSSSDVGYSIQQTTDEGFVISGYTSSFSDGESDVWLIKTDTEGNEEWNQTFGGNSGEGGNSIQQTSDDGFVIIGSTNSFGNGGTDVWLIKTDSEGNEEWNQTFGGSSNDMGYSVIQTIDGGFSITGRTSSIGAGSYDIWLIKTDSEGNEEWNQTFGGIYGDEGSSLQQIADGDFIILGSTFSFGYGSQDAWLIKVIGNGCTDIFAINYDPYAPIDDGSCYYLEDIEQNFTPVWVGFPNQPMGIYIQSAILDSTNLRIGDEVGVFDSEMCVGSLQLTSEIEGSVDIYVSLDNPDTPEIDGYIPGNVVQYRFWDASAQLEVLNVSSLLIDGSDVFSPLGFSSVNLSAITLLGCPDPFALNYQPDITVDDGSCVYPIIGCIDSVACNYNPEANVEGDCVYFDCTGECAGYAVEDDCGVCDDDPNNDDLCIGCTDIWALNYDSFYTIDDGSCIYPEMGDISMDGIINVNDIVLLVDIVLDGSIYIEYVDLNQDNYLNIIDIVMMVEIILL